MFEMTNFADCNTRAGSTNVETEESCHFDGFRELFQSGD